MKRYMQECLDVAHKDGGTGVIAEFVRIEKEGGAVSRDEMVSMLFLLLFAGHETTTHLISGSVRELLLAPEWRDWLEQDWSRTEPAVEEFLRFVSAVQFTKPRFVRKDVELGGVRLKKGEKIMPMLVAANFDPEANDHPDKLDLERRANRHLAFGAGIHFLPGSPARAHRGQVRAAGSVRAVAEARAGDGRFKPSLAHANRHSSPRAIAGHHRHLCRAIGSSAMDAFPKSSDQLPP